MAFEMIGFGIYIQYLVKNRNHYEINGQRKSSLPSSLELHASTLSDKMNGFPQTL